MIFWGYKVLQINSISEEISPIYNNNGDVFHAYIKVSVIALSECGLNLWKKSIKDRFISLKKGEEIDLFLFDFNKEEMEQLELAVVHYLQVVGNVEISGFGKLRRIRLAVQTNTYHVGGDEYGNDSTYHTDTIGEPVDVTDDVGRTSVEERKAFDLFRTNKKLRTIYLPEQA